MKKIYYILSILLLTGSVCVANEIQETTKETGLNFLQKEFVENLKKAESGDKAAQFEMGKSYSSGLGVTQNYKQAYIWFSLAAAQGHEEAKIRQNRIEKKLTSQQLGDAQDMALHKQLTMLKQNTLKPLPVEHTVGGKFITNEKKEVLFIITGRIENPTPHTVSNVKIKGVLFIDDNIRSMDRIVLCGNIIDEDKLKKMNMTQIEKQLMHKNVSINPGESAPFMVVFSDLPENLTNFTVSVFDFKTL